MGTRRFSIWAKVLEVKWNKNKTNFSVLKFNDVLRLMTHKPLVFTMLCMDKKYNLKNFQPVIIKKRNNSYFVMYQKILFTTPINIVHFVKIIKPN